MPAVDPVILQLRADLQSYQNQLRSTTVLVDKSLRDQERAVTRLESQIKRSSTEIGGSLKGLAGSFAAYFSGRELVGIIDSFTQFENKLRVAGVAASDMGNVQDRLFASAQRYGVEIGALGGLFGSLTAASKELGASQEDVFRLTDAVSAAIKVSGGSAQEASGAITQLAQALRGGKIQAEEYNSLIDGLYPLLEAAANGSDRFGGSVGELTRRVKAGEVTSREFMQAVLAGSTELEGRASRATLTLSGAYTTLTNSLTVYVGQAAQTSGVQSALATGLTTLADNIDLVATALAVIAATMATKYVASAGAATLATLRADAALFGLTTRAEVAGFAIGTLARALAINGLIVGVTVALGSFGAEMARTSTLVDQANSSYEEMRKRLEASAQSAAAAGSGARGVGDGAASAEPKVRSFAGAVGTLAQQLYEQAKAARAAKVEMLGKQLAESQGREIEIGRRTPTGRNAAVADFRRGDFLNNIGVIGRAASGGLMSLLTGGRSDRELQAAYSNQVDVSRDLQRRLRDAQSAPLQSYVSTPSITGGTGGTGRRVGAGRSTSAATKDVFDAAQFVTSIRRDLAEITSRTGMRILNDTDRLQQAAEAFREVFGDQPDVIGNAVAEYENDTRREADLNAQSNRRLLDQQEDDIRSLASMYEDLFLGGTDAVWRNFKQQGLRTLAFILAQATLTSFAKGGGGFGSLLGNIVSGADSLFGRASGGYVGPGQVVRVNEQRGGAELLRMGSQGGTVIPLGQVDQAARRPQSPVIVHAPQFNLKGAILTRELYADMERISNESASAAGEAAYSQAIKDAPGAVARAKRFGTGGF